MERASILIRLEYSVQHNGRALGAVLDGGELRLGKAFLPVAFYAVKDKTNPDNAQYALSGCLS